MIVLYKQITGGFEWVADYGDDLASAYADAAAFSGWQIEDHGEIGDQIVATSPTP
jgi:hypothetical protein